MQGAPPLSVMYGSSSSLLSRRDIKLFSRQRAAFLVLKVAAGLTSLLLLTVLAWLRIDWGITDLVHQVRSIALPPHRLATPPPCRSTSLSSGVGSTSCLLVG